MVDSYTDVLLPPFAKYLSRYGEWRLSDLAACILMPSSEFHFNSVLVKSRRLSYSADKSWIFVASVIIYDQTQFSHGMAPLWQKIKGYECELVRKGLLRKSFQFQSSPLLIELQKAIPELVVHTTLMEMLNQDNLLQECISKVVPEEIVVHLFSQPIDTKDFNEYCQEYRKRYESPSDLIWNIKLEKFLGPIISKKKYNETLDKILEILELITLSIQRFTRLIETSL
ncbi:MAG: hypothetical protein ACFFDT_05905 [Candidatus Hodarchaeota archaeon]